MHITLRSHPTGQNLVTDPHLAAREARKGRLDCRAPLLAGLMSTNSPQNYLALKAIKPQPGAVQCRFPQAFLRGAQGPGSGELDKQPVFPTAQGSYADRAPGIGLVSHLPPAGSGLRFLRRKVTLWHTSLPVCSLDQTSRKGSQISSDEQKKRKKNQNVFLGKLRDDFKTWKCRKWGKVGVVAVGVQ